MQFDLKALYQKSLLGGIGGLLGWGLMVLLVHVSGEGAMVYVRAMLMGAVIGLALGACLGMYEGLFRDRSGRRLALGALIGAGIGCLAGMIGLPLGQLIDEIGNHLIFRAIGWGVFGALLGLNEGVARRMPQKMLFGAYGGLIGGLVGGSTYESLNDVFRAMGVGHGTAIAWSGAVGLTLLGMFIGLFMGLVEDLLRAAWLLFTTGRFEGQTRTLDAAKAQTTLGRNETADICILGDPAIARHHARIVAGGGQFFLEAVEGEVRVSHDGRAPFTPITRHALQNGDMLQIGSQRARFLAGR